VLEEIKIVEEKEKEEEEKKQVLLPYHVSYFLEELFFLRFIPFE